MNIFEYLHDFLKISNPINQPLEFKRLFEVDNLKLFVDETHRFDCQIDGDLHQLSVNIQTNSNQSWICYTIQGTKTPFRNKRNRENNVEGRFIKKIQKELNGKTTKFTSYNVNLFLIHHERTKSSFGDILLFYSKKKIKFEEISYLLNVDNKYYPKDFEYIEKNEEILSNLSKTLHNEGLTQDPVKLAYIMKDFLAAQGIDLGLVQRFGVNYRQRNEPDIDYVFKCFDALNPPQAKIEDVSNDIPKFGGKKLDGDPLVFLHENYQEFIDRKEIYPALLKKIDKKLFDALNNSIRGTNKDLKEILGASKGSFTAKEVEKTSDMKSLLQAAASRHSR